MVRMNQRATARGQTASESKQLHLAATGNVQQSQFVHQIANANAEGFGNTQKSKDAGSFLASFQLANVNRVQVSFFRQFFLAKLGALSKSANGFADDLLVSQGFRHAVSGKQEAGEINTVYSTLFFPCLFLGKGIKIYNDSE